MHVILVHEIYLKRLGHTPETKLKKFQNKEKIFINKKESSLLHRNVSPADTRLSLKHKTNVNRKFFYFSFFEFFRFYSLFRTSHIEGHSMQEMYPLFS